MKLVFGNRNGFTGIYHIVFVFKKKNCLFIKFKDKVLCRKVFPKSHIYQAKPLPIHNELYK